MPWRSRASCCRPTFRASVNLAAVSWSPVMAASTTFAKVAQWGPIPRKQPQAPDNSPATIKSIRAKTSCSCDGGSFPAPNSVCRAICSQHPAATGARTSAWARDMVNASSDFGPIKKFAATWAGSKVGPILRRVECTATASSFRTSWNCGSAGCSFAISILNKQDLPAC